MSVYEEQVRAALLRLVGRPSGTPEPPIAIETRSSISTRLVSCDGRTSVLEMRHKAWPTIVLAAQVSLQMGRPLHWLPRDVWLAYWHSRHERWETEQRVTKSMAEAEGEHAAGGGR